MNNGCICCTVRGDLIRILGKLLKRRAKFDHIMIETTGLANPAPVIQTFFVDDDLKEATRLDAVVTVADAKHLLQHLDEVKEEGVVNEAGASVAALGLRAAAVDAARCWGVKGGPLAPPGRKDMQQRP